LLWINTELPRCSILTYCTHLNLIEFILVKPAILETV
jgi:hypothetical protein